MNMGALNCLRGERAEEKREGKRNQGPPLVQEGGGCQDLVCPAEEICPQADQWALLH